MIDSAICKTCKKSYPISEFYKTKKGYYLYKCGDCNRQYRRNLYTNAGKAIRKNWTARYNKVRDELYLLKSKIGCCICKERDPRSLDFHHKDPEQKAGQVLEIRMRFGEEKAMEEISKCDVICANCHRKHHQNLQIYDSDIPILGDHI